ncbi:MAG: hypothetical protein CMJ84_18110 [Planctomycetes bacterium]|jgi:hypothetical protein|nr:hypothetical protein [Planctomycetota bacterium]MDP6410555.1 hypothetical protein [Planctomycetota bacterium]
MDPETLLNQLCERHGVSRNEGYRLLPLIRWALRGPDETREKILAVVEQTLAVRAGEGEDDGSLEHAADQAILVAVARVLHDWTPSTGLIDSAEDGEFGETG